MIIWWNVLWWCWQLVNFSGFFFYLIWPFILSGGIFTSFLDFQILCFCLFLIVESQTNFVLPIDHFFSLGPLTSDISGVHVLLVSLLVDQLSGLFLIFLVDQNKNCLVSETGQKNFGQSMNFFWSVSLLEGGQKNSETDPKKLRDWPKFFCPVSETGQFFFGRPKKWQIDWIIGRPRDWPKVHGRR